MQKFEVIGFDESGKNIIFLKKGKLYFIDARLHKQSISEILPTIEAEECGRIKRQIREQAEQAGHFKFLYRFTENGKWYNYNLNLCKHFLERRLFKCEKIDGQSNKKSSKRRYTKRSQKSEERFKHSHENG